MPNVLRAADSLVEATFGLAGEAAKAVWGEFRRHPKTTPLVAISGILIGLEAITRHDAHKRRDQAAKTAQQVAEQMTANTAEIDLNIPETAQND